MTLMATCWSCNRHIEDALCVTVLVDGHLETVCHTCMERAEEAETWADEPEPAEVA